jgi:hypothetical protein
VVVAVGAGVPATIGGDADRSPVAVAIPASVPRDTVVWAHTVTPDGRSVGLTGAVAIDRDAGDPLVRGRVRLVLPPGDAVLKLETSLLQDAT